MAAMNNLPEPHFQPSSLQPGCSGESENAPYGPKAFESDTIEGLKGWGNATHDTSGKFGWAVGGVGDLSQTKEKSSLRP